MLGVTCNGLLSHLERVVVPCLLQKLLHCAALIQSFNLFFGGAYPTKLPYRGQSLLKSHFKIHF